MIVYLLFTILVGLAVASATNECIDMDKYSLPAKVERPKWAIVALTRKLDILDKRNGLIAKAIKPFASKHDITVIIFSEVDFGAAVVDKWKQTFQGIAQVCHAIPSNSHSNVEDRRRRRRR